MTLTTRLTGFFLAGLAVTLLMFSLVVYLLMRERLYAEVDARAISSLNTLTAAAEVDERGVEWEVSERLIVVDHGRGDGFVCYSVTAPGNRSLETYCAGGDEPPKFDMSNLGREHPYTQANARGELWRVFHRRIEAPPPTELSSKAHFGERDPSERFAYIDLSVAVPCDAVTSALRGLALILTGVSIAVWLAAFVSSCWICRRALRPVTAMATRARAITVNDLGERLPVPATRDELATLGNSFNGLLDRVEEAFERQQRFAGDASHQLRTPLAALLGQVEVCLRHPRSDSEYRETLEKVHGRGEHLRLIVESLLFLTRSDADALPAALEAVDLAEWLQDHLQSCTANSRAADLHVAIDPGPYPVKLHSVLFGQLLDNLLDNAFSYSPNCSPVTIGMTTKGGSIVLSITDCGVGILAEDLPLIFNPFFRSASARRSGNTGIGLGLAIARRIATAHGGTITVRSEPHQGTRFQVRVPRRLTEFERNRVS